MTRPVWPGERWEYLSLEMVGNTAENIRALNALGAVGWELVESSLFDYTMKRRLPK